MNKEKYVDESWKESAEQEKETLSDAAKSGSESDAAEKEQALQNKETNAAPTPQESPQAQESTQPESAVEVNFLNYITSLAFQAMIFMGEIPNPVTNETEKNLQQSKFLIDTLAMLKDKTQGNLTEQEGNMINATVYELQMKYVETVKKEETA